VIELANGPMNYGLAAGSAWEVFAEINFLHFAFFLFLVCVLLLIGVSLLTQEPAREKVAGLTYALADADVVGVESGVPVAAAGPERVDLEVEESEEQIDTAWQRLDLQLTIGLLVAVAAVWLYFS